MTLLVNLVACYYNKWRSVNGGSWPIVAECKRGSWWANNKHRHQVARYQMVNHESGSSNDDQHLSATTFSSHGCETVRWAGRAENE
eukprot:scaffold168025_cov36-Prasinocladus_malaysianus.AAC.2